MTGNIVDIEDLSIHFETQQGPAFALRNVNVAVPRGQIIGIVGESGSGKSTLALAMMRLLPGNAVVGGGSIRFFGQDLLNLPADQMRALRGTRLAMIFQDPMTSLNPVRSIGHQMLDIQYRSDIARGAKLTKAADALKRVGIPDAREQLGRFPAEFSGGMRQRICIAMSLLQKPELLIADEITTALDVTLEAQVLHLLRELRQELNGSILFISHNLGAVAEICDSVVVLYAGEVVEQGPVFEIFDRPQHPYTRALVECDPARIAEITRELPVIPGDVPNLHAIPKACIFAPRCSAAIDICRRHRPATVAIGKHHTARCHLLEGAVA
jgi:oligopeptide/dipeptide ABC transporter ATP-binding protein